MPESPITTDLSGKAGKFIKVKSDESGLEFVTSTPGGGVELGESSSDAHRADHGITAYEHSQSAHAPSNAQKNSDITKAEIEAKLTGAISSHTHDYAASSHNHDATYEAKNANIQAHIISAHAPSDSQKNSDITKAEIEAKLTGAISSHTHDYAATGHNHSGVYEPVITNGFGITGTTTKAVSLTNSTAFVTAETTIAAATYADITGATLTLAAGTWLIFGQVNIRFVNAIVQAFVAITDGANTVLSEIAASRPASGTANLNSPFSCNLFAIVTPVGSTTYKLRGARGVTTHTGSWTAMDGAGTNTANHASNNSDKGTGIFAIRIA